MQKSVMPVAGNNITLMNVNCCAVISRHVEFVLKLSRCFSSAQIVPQNSDKCGSLLHRKSFIFFVTERLAVLSFSAAAILWLFQLHLLEVPAVEKRNNI